MVDRCWWIESLPAIHVFTVPSILYWIEKFLTAGHQKLLNLPNAFEFAIGLSKKQVQFRSCHWLARFPDLHVYLFKSGKCANK